LRFSGSFLFIHVLGGGVATDLVNKSMPPYLGQMSWRALRIEVGGMGLAVLAFRRVYSRGAGGRRVSLLSYLVIGQFQPTKKVRDFSQSKSFCKKVSLFRFAQVMPEGWAMQATRVCGFVCFPTHGPVVTHSSWR